MEKKRIVFLYTEIAEYFLAGCQALLEKDVEIHVVRYPVNKEAPFKFKFPGKIKFYERNTYEDPELIDLVNSIDPDAIICSGWMDKGYKKCCRRFRKAIPVIVIIDNQWKATWRQRLAAFLSPLVILNSYSHAFVPGSFQFEYAKRLGFKSENILTGFYTADVSYFHNLYLENKESKKDNFPRKFIYVGRYYEFKGVRDLWRAFIELQKEQPNDWELWCLGTGDIEPMEHSSIKHFGFVQPENMKQYIMESGVFVLPSHFEPWGVVVHEFASAGFPLICSDETGSRVSFVENEKNGFIFQAGNIHELKSVLKKVMDLGQERLFEMAEISASKALEITPEKWAQTIINALN
jgi:glycosyltransferase involved in cell wall biosynthesis